MDDKQQVIYTAANSQQAHLLCNILEDCGIDATVTNEALQGASGELAVGWSTDPRVMVSERDAEKARQVALDFEQRLADSDDETDSYDNPSDNQWADWPTCPRCSLRRQVVCKVCETAGTNFQLAEFVVEAAPIRQTQTESEESGKEETDDGPPLLLICPNCDESFPPRFFRYCEDCGHDFGFGVELQLKEPPEVNGRAIIVVVALGLLALAFSAYFAFIAR